MAEERTQAAKESKGNLLKKFFRIGSQSTTHSRSDLVSPEEAAKLRAKYIHFRILVIGRANAGKTTLLKRVCNTKEDPIYNSIIPTEMRGIHDVCAEFTFKSNPGFIFHDSPGFEAGGEEELKAVMSFIEDKAKARVVKDQIHAIWFCFDPDVSRPLLALEKKFFNMQRAGNVPVVAIFTKFDVLITRVYDRNKDEKENLEIAGMTLEEKFLKPLKDYDYPPRAYVRFESIDEDEGNHPEQVKELIRQTTVSIDDLALKMLFVTIQQNNLEICIECAVNKYVFKVKSIEELISSAISWFGHCYGLNKDYGYKDRFFTTTFDRTTGKRFTGTRTTRTGKGTITTPTSREFVNHILPLVKGHYDTPSLPAFAAILICLESSFWHTQQGYLPAEGFLMALDLYSALDKDKYFISQRPNNWFTVEGYPSQAECTQFMNDILANRLSHPDSQTTSAKH